MAFYDKIMAQVADLDIGLAVMNAGVAIDKEFLKVSSEKLQEMIDTNSYQVGAMLHKLNTRFKQRSKRSGVIIVSSVVAEFQFSAPKLFAYAATKIFVKYLCKIYDWENKNANRQIDTLCLQPAYV